MQSKPEKLINSEEVRNEQAERLYNKAIKEYELSVVYNRYKEIWEKLQV